MRGTLLVASLIFLLVACVRAEGKNNSELTRLIHAAEAGDAESMYSVFFLIAQKGSPEHPQTDEEIKLAKHWLVKAGENNNWRAAHVLQLCHEIGCWGLPIDLEKSKHYKAVLEKYGPDQLSNLDVQQQASPAVNAH